MEFHDYLDEFQADWALARRAVSTGRYYRRYLEQLDAYTGGDITLPTVKVWLADSPSAETARGRARAIRAFGKWSESNDGPDWSWWPKVPLAATRPTPQPTVTEDVYKAVRGRCKSLRDALVVELLWSTGLRASELERLTRDDVNLADRFVVVRTSKAGKPRLAPLSDQACRLIRRHQESGRELIGITRNGIRLLMQRLDAPSPHAWRRGWAVHALRAGVSQASLQAAAGWAAPSMTARYVAALSGELAIREFSARTSQDFSQADIGRPWPPSPGSS